jgi:hypothetical protein
VKTGARPSSEHPVLVGGLLTLALSALGYCRLYKWKCHSLLLNFKLAESRIPHRTAQYSVVHGAVPYTIGTQSRFTDQDFLMYTYQGHL